MAADRRLADRCAVIAPDRVGILQGCVVVVDDLFLSRSTGSGLPGNGEGTGRLPLRRNPGVSLHDRVLSRHTDQLAAGQPASSPVGVRDTAAPLARFEEPPDLGDLGIDRSGEPAGRHQVVQPPERTMAELEFLDMTERVPPSTASISNHAWRLRGTPCSSVTSMVLGRTHRYRVITDPGNRPRNFPSSRATIPSGVSASLVTQTILVSALVYWAGSRTKSKTSSGVTPRTTAVPSPLITSGLDLHRFLPSTRASLIRPSFAGNDSIPRNSMEEVDILLAPGLPARAAGNQSPRLTFTGHPDPSGACPVVENRRMAF